MSFCLTADEEAFLHEIYLENHEKDFSEWCEHLEADFASLAEAR